MLFAVVTKTSSFDISLEGYPDWLVLLVGTLVAALAIWILIKVIKVALWLLFVAVLVGGLATALWYFLHP